MSRATIGGSLCGVSLVAGVQGKGAGHSIIHHSSDRLQAGRPSLVAELGFVTLCVCACVCVYVCVYVCVGVRAREKERQRKAPV